MLLQRCTDEHVHTGELCADFCQEPTNVTKTVVCLLPTCLSLLLNQVTVNDFRHLRTSQLQNHVTPCPVSLKCSKQVILLINTFALFSFTYVLFQCNTWPNFLITCCQFMYNKFMWDKSADIFFCSSAPPTRCSLWGAANQTNVSLKTFDKGRGAEHHQFYFDVWLRQSYSKYKNLEMEMSRTSLH